LRRTAGVSPLGDRAASGGATLRPLNPATGAPLATVQTASAEDDDRAVERAA
jgi:acyl-CoA reductase-like NAD-dependent aldehyde dehydrogenase